MAFRKTSQWRSMLTQLGQNRQFASSTSPKFATMSHNATNHKRSTVMGDWAPIMVIGGMVLVVVGMGLHSLKQQLVHHPGVNVRKERRESIAELESPDMVGANGNKFLNKSFLRRVARIQDPKNTMSDPTPANPFAKPHDAKTPKTVGVDPKKK